MRVTRSSSAGAAPQASLDALRLRLRPVLARVRVASASLASTVCAEEPHAYVPLDVRRDAAGKEVPDQVPATTGELQRCAAWLARGATLVQEELDANPDATVVVHCNRGASRSPAVVLAWLMRYHEVKTVDLPFVVEILNESCAVSSWGNALMRPLDAWATSLEHMS